MVDRRRAVAELGRALHDLVQAAVATEVETEELRRVAAAVRAVTEPLARVARSRDEFPRADDILGGIRLYNPVTGSGSPIAPPLHITMRDGRVEATCTLGLAFEGPPRHVHGGVSAMLLDQLLGYAVAAAGRPGMTRDLALRYRRPVPLETPLHLSAEVVEQSEDGRRVTAFATIATADDPSTVLAEATGTFVPLRQEHARVLFATAARSD
jgi:acyl-coenzyme A thioesterase PaaI-like protein